MPRLHRTVHRAVHRAAAVLAALTLLAVVSGCGLFGDDAPEEVAGAFAAAWAAGDDARAAGFTGDPAAAGELLASVRESLAPAGLAVEVEQVRSATDRATASLAVRWDLGEGRVWSYLNEVELRPAPEAELGWEVAWAPTVVHPDLAARQGLSLSTDPPEPAPVVDRAGVPLLVPTTVVSVLLDRQAAGDLPAVAGALAAALSPIEPAITTESILDGAARTPDGQAYVVAVLRDPDYQQVKPAIYDLPGLRFTTSQRLLAPDAGFARQVLPGVRQEAATQLDGVPGWSVRVVDARGGTVRTLAEEAPRPGTTVTVGLDRGLQTPAEDAVEPVAQQAMLVAVEPSTGALLAVAQNDAADAEGPLALTGRYPPGSTFKIVTAAAGVTEDALTVDSPVACPGSTVVGGREIPNSEGFDLGTVPLVTAFARSCNTTFAQIAADMGPGVLPAAAERFGLGADHAVPGLVTVTGSVPPSDDPVQRAEDGIGQGQVLASPFGMALVAATVARGGPVVPQLITDRPTEVLRAPGEPDP
ncbi:MAG TPA: penicillin-binding transpeptidase domain-containing protein, partial [Pseudonocardia sp.]|nr:penicillin-binding transpeptidase domain-containing protein [Pseudonocardia sp.]